MPSERPPRLAVLIDADNASAKIVDRLFVEIATLGDASLRRIYGDFSGTRLKPWADVLSAYAITPYQQFAYVTGKNASDIALVIEAMDLLHSRRFDGFCLVSSDSDFTTLALRLREEGVDVYGFGEQKTPESFRKACRRFIFTENLVDAPHEDKKRGRALESIDNARKTLEPVIAEMATAEDWVSLSTIGNKLTNLFPDFDPRTYGFRKLRDLVASIKTLEIVATEGQQPRVRLRQTETRKAKRDSPPPATKAR